MIFRRTIIAALFVGFLAGLVLSIAQIISVNPIIFKAETFEVAEEHTHASQTLAEEVWAPEDGTERSVYTILANASAGVGYAAILLALMSQLQLQGLTRVSLPKGIVWGAAGFLVFFVAPGIGLPPEIPGVEAAPIQHRQYWWLFAVIATGLGLLVLGFAPVKWKLLGLPLIILPYLLGAPHSEGPTFAHPDSEVLATLTHLHQQFIFASGVSNLLFWIVLGVASSWALNAWVLKGIQPAGVDGEPINA